MRLNSTDNQITRIYNNNSEGIVSKSRVNKTQTPQKQKLAEFNEKVSQPDSILSDNEKNFFKKMFPESTASLDRHVVFNRNGKVQSKTFALGTMLDAKV